MIGPVSAALSAAATCGLTALAVHAAKRYGLQFEIRSPLALCALAFGTVLQTIAVWHSTNAPAAAVLAIALGAAVVSAVSDALTGYVFDAVTFPALGLATLLAACSSTLPSAISGALAGAAALGLLYAITLGRGLGLGDVKLACCIGAALGAGDALAALAVAFISGGAYAAILLLTGRGARGTCVRFAPFLAGGMLSLALYRIPA